MSELDIILLPGGSKYTKKWSEDFKRVLDKDFRYVYPVIYENWSETDDRFDIYKESDDVSKQIRRTDNYIGIAYQEGCIVALKEIYEKRFKPKAMVFIGFPYEWSRSMKLDDEVRRWLHSVNVPTLFIQQDKDQEIEREDLRELVDDAVDKFQIQTIWNDSDGEYDDLYELLKYIKEFID